MAPQSFICKRVMEYRNLFQTSVSLSVPFLDYAYIFHHWEIIAYTWDPFFHCACLKPSDMRVSLGCVKSAGSAFCDQHNQQFFSLGWKVDVPTVILNSFIVGQQYLIMVYTRKDNGIC